VYTVQHLQELVIYYCEILLLVFTDYLSTSFRGRVGMQLDLYNFGWPTLGYAGWSRHLWPA